MSTDIARTVDGELERLRTVIGAGYVLTAAAEREAHAKDTSQFHQLPLAVIYPGTAEQVAEVLRVATEFGLAVWPYSKGKNWGYGAHMPLGEHAIVLLLDRMNRILEVNEELAYAVIEPGVTQEELNAHLRSTGSRLWADCTDSTPQGSVIGNALERGVGYTPAWDHFGNLCGLEVVLPTGETVRTGGGPPDSLSWHTYKWGTGPYLEGLFSQSNFGIVTRAGVWLMPAPAAVKCFICEVGDDRGLAPAVDAIRELALRGVLRRNVHLVNDVMFLAQLTQFPYDQLDGATTLSPQALAGLRDRYRVAPWTVTGGLYGSHRQVRLAAREVRRALGRYGRVQVFGVRGVSLLGWLADRWRSFGRVPGLTRLLAAVTHASAEKLALIPALFDVLRGIPGERIVTFAYFKSRRPRPTSDVDPGRDGAGLTWMAVVSPLTGTHTRALADLCAPIFARHGFDFSITYIMVNPRTTLGLIELFYDREDPDQCARMPGLYDELASETLAAGYQQYRTSVWYGERILGASAALHRMLDTMKSAVDPHGILAPGRYSIGRRPS